MSQEEGLCLHVEGAMPVHATDHPGRSYLPRRRASIDLNGEVTHVVCSDRERLHLSTIRFRPRIILTDHGLIGILLEGFAGEVNVGPVDRFIKHEIILRSTYSIDDLIRLYKGMGTTPAPHSILQEGNRDFLWSLCQSMLDAMCVRLGKPIVIPSRATTDESAPGSLHDQEIVDVELSIQEFVAHGSYFLLLPNGKLDPFVLMLIEEMKRAEARRFKPI